MLGDEEMAGRGHRKEFGETFDHAENDGGDPVRDFHRGKIGSERWRAAGS
jgi:hypothetical protein